MWPWLVDLFGGRQSARSIHFIAMAAMSGFVVVHLALVFLALGHMFIMHVLVELTGGEIDFAFVQSRWGTPFWRIYDLLLLVLAFIHGANGARVVIGDYVVNRTARSLLIGILLAISAVWLVLGMAVIAFFDPSSAPPVGPFS